MTTEVEQTDAHAKGTRSVQDTAEQAAPGESSVPRQWRPVPGPPLMHETLMQETKKRTEACTSVLLVAGVGFEPTTFGL